VRAPAHFGRFSGALLVGNFGDGRINAYSGDADSAGALTVTVEEYEAAHSTPNRFTVKPRSRLRGRGVHQRAARPLLGGGEAPGRDAGRLRTATVATAERGSAVGWYSWLD
jgi:hypothetical protein